MGATTEIDKEKKKYFLKIWKHTSNNEVYTYESTSEGNKVCLAECFTDITRKRALPKQPEKCTIQMIKTG